MTKECLFNLSLVGAVDDDVPEGGFVITREMCEQVSDMLGTDNWDECDQEEVFSAVVCVFINTKEVKVQ